MRKSCRRSSARPMPFSRANGTSLSATPCTSMLPGGNAFYLKTDRRRRDLAAVRDRSATDNVLLASSTTETTLAAARPKPGVMQWLYATFAEAQPSKSCDQTASAFGATSLACEDEHAGR